MNSELLQRQIATAIKLRDLGCTFQFIAWKLGVSKDRARTLVGKANRREATLNIKLETPSL